MASLSEKIEKLNRKAVKLNVPEIVTKVLGMFQKEQRIEICGEHVKVMRRYYNVEVIGGPVALPGWIFVGTLEHTPVGNVIRSVPNQEVPEHFRTTAASCDHCKLARNRKDTYLVRNEEGSIKQVGHQCVADYLGSAAPAYIAMMAEIVKTFSELSSDEGGFGYTSKTPIFTKLFMDYAAEMVIRFGFISRSAAQKYSDFSNTVASTSTTALQHMFPTKDMVYKNEAISPSVEAAALAEAALAWVNSPDFDVTGDYGWNLKIVCAKETLEHRDTGIAASAISAYHKYLGKQTERKEKMVSGHVGTVGNRETFKIVVTGVHVFPGDYGDRYLYRMEDDAGNTLVWWASSNHGLEVGLGYAIKATVKEHALYKGAKQTVLSRCSEVPYSSPKKSVKKRLTNKGNNDNVVQDQKEVA